MRHFVFLLSCALTMSVSCRTRNYNTEEKSVILSGNGGHVFAAIVDGPAGEVTEANWRSRPSCLIRYRLSPEEKTAFTGGKSLEDILQSPTFPPYTLNRRQMVIDNLEPANPARQLLEQIVGNQNKELEPKDIGKFLREVDTTLADAGAESGQECGTIVYRSPDADKSVSLGDWRTYTMIGMQCLSLACRGRLTRYPQAYNPSYPYPVHQIQRDYDSW